jgi:hypothetical protein
MPSIVMVGPQYTLGTILAEQTNIVQMASEQWVEIIQIALRLISAGDIIAGLRTDRARRCETSQPRSP